MLYLFDLNYMIIKYGDYILDTFKLTFYARGIQFKRRTVKMSHLNNFYSFFNRSFF
jgi:hypothetical protein